MDVTVLTKFLFYHILQTEKSLVEKQRDIALKERERMVTEAISLKKRLETIKVT